MSDKLLLLEQLVEYFTINPYSEVTPQMAATGTHGDQTTWVSGAYYVIFNDSRYKDGTVLTEDEYRQVMIDKQDGVVGKKHVGITTSGIPPQNYILTKSGMATIANLGRFLSALADQLMGQDKHVDHLTQHFMSSIDVKVAVYITNNNDEKVFMGHMWIPASYFTTALMKSRADIDPHTGEFKENAPQREWVQFREITIPIPAFLIYNQNNSDNDRIHMVVISL